MSYRRDLAVQTIVAVAAALKANWPALSAATQSAVRQIIVELGREIYDQAPFNRAGRMVALLDAIAGLPDLPGSVLDALSAGAGTSGSLVKVTDEQRDHALEALRTIHDGRRYVEPVALAAAVRRKVAQLYGRLDPDLRVRWEALDKAFAEGGNPVEYLDRVDSLLGEHLPAVREAISAGKTWSDAVYRTAARPKDPFSGEDFKGESLMPKGDLGSGALPGDLAPPSPSPSPVPSLVRRFANVYFPAQVHRGQQRVPLIVHVAQQVAEGTVPIQSGSALLAVAVGDLTIVVYAEDFEVQYGLGGSAIPVFPKAASVPVQPSGDCEPVVFFLTPTAPGAKKVSIEFFQNGRPAGSLVFGTTVVESFDDGAGVGQVEVRPVSLVAGSPGAAPPELNLRVIRLGDGLSYEFILVTGDDPLGQQSLGRVTLRSDPRAYFKGVSDELSSLARVSADQRTPEETEQTIARLRELGARLWDELLPAGFKAEYRAGRFDAYKGKGFVITSDEPWIPWEMVRPFERDRGRTLYSDPPLCELFRLSRWLSGSGMRDRLAVRRGVVVAPVDNLKSVQEEIDYFKQVGLRAGEGKWQVPILTLGDVSREMEAGLAEVFHFSCHGNFQYDDPEESLLKLGGAFLRPSNIRFSERIKIWQSAPLVFLNACHAGRAGITLTRLGGWAESFIGAGASAFVGSLWEINDRLAARFAREFYNRLWGLDRDVPQTIGEAFHAARMVIKAEDEANPTWLAYTLYGDPNGRVSFGG